MSANQPTIRVLLKSLAVGIIATLLLHLPFFGLLFALLAAPLMLFVPSLGATGTDVAIGFAWISLKSAFAWITFIGYFSLIAGLWLKLWRYIKTKRKN